MIPESNEDTNDPIEEYLTSRTNLVIYTTLKEDSIWDGVFEPIEFFKLLDSQTKYIEAHKHSPVRVRKHLMNLDLLPKQSFFLFREIGRRLYLSNNIQLQICRELILDMERALEKELFFGLFTWRDKIIEDREKAETINDLRLRVQFFRDEMKEFKMQTYGLSEEGKKTIHNVLYWYRMQIAGLEDSIIANTQESHPTSDSIKPIWWQRSDRLLGYLMENLAQKGFIDKESPILRHIKDHFINKKKERFGDSIKQNLSGMANNKDFKPKGYEDIDELIKSMGGQSK